MNTNTGRIELNVPYKCTRRQEWLKLRSELTRNRTKFRAYELVSTGDYYIEIKSWPRVDAEPKEKAA